MEKCWAKKLGNCVDSISREHIISRGLFESEKIKVKGLPWCKKQEKEIGLSSLTSKMLCKKHNNQLSQVDEEGARAFSTFRKMMRITKVRRKIKMKNPNLLEYYIDGKLFERWFLKTLINICYNTEYPIGSDSDQLGYPSKRLVEIAFGEKEFSGNSGLYFVIKEGHIIDSGDFVYFAPLYYGEKYICGGMFKFMGFRILLFLEKEGLSDRLPRIKFGDENWGNAKLNFRLETINETLNGKPSQRVHIQW